MLNPRIVLALAAVAVLLGAAAEPPAPPPAGPQVPFWSQSPSRAVWDAALAAAGIKPADGGMGMVLCKVKADGGLENCSVTAVRPSGESTRS